MKDHNWMKSSDMSIGGVILAIFILAWGTVWLGNDLRWWNIDFPFWPVVAIMIGLTILFHELRKAIR